MFNQSSSSKYVPPYRRGQQNQELEETASRRDNSLQKTYNPYFHSSREGLNRSEYDSNQRQHHPETRDQSKKLEELIKKDLKTVVLEITKHQYEFEQLVDSELTNHAIVLVVKTLAKVSSVDVVKNNDSIKSLLSKEKFHSSLQKFVLELTLHTSADREKYFYFWKNPENFFSNAAIIFQSLMECEPSRACEVLPKTLKACKLSLNSFSEADLKKALVLELLDVLDNNLEWCKLRNSERVSGRDVTSDDDSDVEPPNNFRHLSIYPTRDEIFFKPVFLRKNLIDKSYQNVNHYLDIQYRLLKEDFVGLLRIFIEEYMRYTGRLRLWACFQNNIRTYTNVKFLSPILTRNQLGVLLQLQNKKCPYIFNLNQKLMYGSLLCFTRDNFQSLLFGKVIERTSELLHKRQIVVELVEENQKCMLGQAYVMVEIPLYFEQYYNVLKALQNKSETQFPMKKYIIDLKLEIEEVHYLQQDTTIDVDNTSQLNNTQCKAFKAALAQEFAVIQGPPGTGKTFLGIKIAERLIKNKRYWCNSSPILVVCYTDHVLDQFLEGLVTTTSDIIRVGGQSKNKNLEMFSLKVKRGSYRKSVDHVALNDMEKKFSESLSVMNNFSNILKDIESNSVILHFKNFIRIEKDLSLSWYASASDEELIDWLLGGISSEQKRNERIRTQKDFVEGSQIDYSNKEFQEIMCTQITNRYYIDDGMDIKQNKSHILTSISKIQKDINDIKIKERDVDDKDNLKIALAKEKWQMERYRLEDQLHSLQTNIEEYKNYQVQTKPPNYNLKNPHDMNEKDRWFLYLYWVEKYKQFIIAELVKQESEYLTLQEQYNEIKNTFDLEMMKRMDIIGMTTMAAAHFQTTLSNLKSTIVIVEEAAKILESHIVVTLTSHCQHLILIGDHQQIQPSCNNFNMEKHYNLGVSLFERMVRNNMQYHTLGMQYRMRPEIASLIVPAIYPNLENHASVYDYPDIVGIASNLYFVDHKFEEEKSGNTSKQNQHEAKFLIALARYLVQNGYKPEDITILAAYWGQIFTLWTEKRRFSDLLEGVRIEVFENYHGEENKIILLSLVRNNKEGKIGNLKIDNRICMALSRAKEGLYMMGNMDMLCARSTIWPKVKDVLLSQSNLGTSLVLRCHTHPEWKTIVRLPTDFNNAYGGCNMVCKTQLLCGHFCTMVCHVLDREHKNFKCKANCTKTCENNHSCPDLCFEPCRPCNVLINTTFPCGHNHKIYCYLKINTFKCPTPVKIKLPCGHGVLQKPCHYPVDLYKCSYFCNTKLDCGHTCSKTCHFKDDPNHLAYKCEKPCERRHPDCSIENHKCPNKCFEKCAPCEIVVEKSRSCSHKVMIPCNKDPNEIVCVERCKRQHPCGHGCKKKCNEPCGDCTVIVTKVSDVCKHMLKIECSKSPIQSLCSKKCTKNLSCGHGCRNKCNEPCTTSCKELIDPINTPECGHGFKIECNKKVYPSNSFRLLQLCPFPCKKELTCGHVCSGTCGECAQGRFHKRCSQKCDVELVCGHTCLGNCNEECKPCTENCSYRCSHIACKKKCGEPCTKCEAPCTRICIHVTCKALCGDVCTVPPCTEPCSKKLLCGHSCIGFCGDPCPPVCRLCTRGQLANIHLSKQPNNNTRYIFLDECKHVVEYVEMNLSLKTNHPEVGPKRCLYCKTILTSTRRYSDYIKIALKDLSTAINKHSCSFKDNSTMRDELLKKVHFLKNCRGLINDSKYDAILETLENATKCTEQVLFRNCLKKVTIIENIVLGFKTAISNTLDLSEHLNFLLSMLLRSEIYLTNQERNDFDREVKRWSLLVQLTQIQGSQHFLRNKNVLFISRFSICRDQLFSSKTLTESLEVSITMNVDYLMKRFVNVKDSNVKLEQETSIKKGHWLKCRFGHIYAIGQLDGDVQITECPYCT